MFSSFLRPIRLPWKRPEELAPQVGPHPRRDQARVRSWIEHPGLGDAHADAGGERFDVLEAHPRGAVPLSPLSDRLMF